MCGIAGIVDFKGTPISLNALDAMTDSLKHRGPDDRGVFTGNLVGLGHRRLSVIDLSTGHQPMSNAAGTVWIVFNGEIYNFRSLRDSLERQGRRFTTASDTEVIIHAYEVYGTNCVQRLDGMFAFALWDDTRKELVLARDRLGKKPLYYQLDRQALLFGSEIKAILKHPYARTEIDLVALDDYLHHGFVPGPRTIYRDIRKLPASTVATISMTGNMTASRYWSVFGGERSVSATADNRLETLQHLLTTAVSDRLVSDVPIGAFLSGGLDSSVVVAEMKELSNTVPRTFTVAFSDHSFDESCYAERVADYLHTDHHTGRLEYEAESVINDIVLHFDEPFADSSAIPTYYLSQLAKKAVTVVLGGDGGDEIFGGYSRYVGQKWARLLAHLPRSLKRSVVALLDRVPDGTGNKALSMVKQMKWLWRAANSMAENPYDLTVRTFDEKSRVGLLLPEVRRVIENVRKENELPYVEEIAKSHQGRDLLTQMMMTDIETYLVDSNLVKIDRMSMAHSLEMRSPLLDHRLVEFMFSVPPNSKVQGTQTKILLKKHAEYYLPQEIIQRRKQGFSVPVCNWLRGELREIAIEFLSNHNYLPWLEPTRVCAVLDEHLAGKRDLGGEVWNLLVLAAWWQRATR